MNVGRKWEKEEQRMADYHRGNSGVCGGKGDIRTGQKLRMGLKRLGVSYDRIATDNWDSFLSVFREDKHEV
jgi:IS1 family transposase